VREGEREGQRKGGKNKGMSYMKGINKKEEKVQGLDLKIH